MVNPCKEYADGKELIKSLDDMKQAPEASLRFWTKLLVEKKALPSQFKRQNALKQADAISKLRRSDIALMEASKSSTPRLALCSGRKS